MPDGAKPLRLTKLGDVAYRHGVLTSPAWWRKVWADTNRLADEDGEWELMLNERIAGLTEMRDRFYEINAEVG